MSKTPLITEISPRYAIPGGEIIIECQGFEVGNGDLACFADNKRCRLIAASQSRLIVEIPDDIFGSVEIVIESNGRTTEPFEITVGELLVGSMHMVANPAVDPDDNSIITTWSGSRGQFIPNPLYRIDEGGYVGDMSAEMMNPTGVAFSSDGSLFVTNRRDGELCRIDYDRDVVTFASGLGIATGLAFDADGIAYVGDRSGVIYRVPEFGIIESFAFLEPSVSAYHLAFAKNGDLLVSAPGLASHDPIYEIDKEGNVSTYVRGFGRPQGLAFDTDGNLYAAACYRGRHGIVKIDANTREIEFLVAGNGIVGLCFSRTGEMIVATGTSIYSLEMGIFGTLLK